MSSRAEVSLTSGASNWPIAVDEVPGGMRSDWMDRIWLEPRRRTGGEGRRPPRPGADGWRGEAWRTGGGVEGAGGRTVPGALLMAEGVGAMKEPEARRSSSDSAGSPTTCRAASSTARALATSPG